MIKTVNFVLLMSVMSYSVLGQAQSASDDLIGGSHVFKVDRFGFAKSSSTSVEPKGKYCAPKGSEVEFNSSPQEANRGLTANFKTVGSNRKDQACDAKKEFIVKKSTQYYVTNAEADAFPLSRRGIVSGGLVVPFKYYLGGDRRITTSTTVAPYVGLQFNNLVRVVVSAGFGLVPIDKTTTADDGAQSTSSDSKPAISVAAGFIITPSDNESFRAGLLIGKDFLSNEDRTADPTANKPWVSFFVGVSM